MGHLIISHMQFLMKYMRKDETFGQVVLYILLCTYLSFSVEK